MAGWDSICKKCGRGDLKARPLDSDNPSGPWALFENERVEHNRLKRHDCQGKFADPADDFEVLE